MSSENKKIVKNMRLKLDGNGYDIPQMKDAKSVKIWNDQHLKKKFNGFMQNADILYVPPPVDPASQFQSPGFMLSPKLNSASESYGLKSPNILSSQRQSLPVQKHIINLAPRRSILKGSQLSLEQGRMDKLNQLNIIKNEME